MNEDNTNRFQERFEERKKRWEARIQRRSSHGHIWTGLFILLIGVAALIRVSFPDMPEWLFSWQTFLIALGFYLGFKHNFNGPAWIILIVIGSAFLLRDFFPALAIGQFIWPSLLILIGALIIVRPRRRFMYYHESQKKNSAGDGITEAAIRDETYNSKEDFINSTSIFSGTKKNIISKNFKGGDIVSIFGGSELDLTQADMTAPAIIETTTIFGGTKLIIPSHWDIKSEAVTIFGGVDDKRKMHTITEPSDKILIIKGTVLFGGIEIKSY